MYSKIYHQFACLISGASIIKVVGLLHTIFTLVVFAGSVDIRAMLQSLLHQGLGTRTMGKVSVATNWGSRASSEIVVRYEAEVASRVKSCSTIAGWFSMLEKYILIMYDWRMASALYLSILKSFTHPLAGENV